MKISKTEIKWQFIVYGIYALLGWLQAYSEHPAEGIYAKEVLNVLGVSVSECLVVNAIGNWLMVKHPISKSPVWFWVYLLLLMGVFFAYRYFVAYPDYTDMLKTYGGSYDKKSVTFFWFVTFINFLISVLVALGMYSIKKSIFMEKRANQLENQIHEAQLNTLKYQINPHFLYNTLSYMYAQAVPVSTNLSKSILILSDMMRYSLAKTDDYGLTLIDKEINYIENFIEIHRLRFDKDFYVNFDVKGIVGSQKVTPMLLITFIENAIKHGRINDSKHPVNIVIDLSRTTINLLVENHKQQGKKDDTSGIGLENTKKRLELLYPQKHVLAITDKSDYFSVSLQINLQ